MTPEEKIMMAELATKVGTTIHHIHKNHPELQMYTKTVYIMQIIDALNGSTEFDGQFVHNAFATFQNLEALCEIELPEPDNGFVQIAKRRMRKIIKQTMPVEWEKYCTRKK